MRTLKEKRVLITGAAHGIGRALALRFAREGADIVVTDIDVPAAEEVVHEIESAGGSACAHALDVTDAAAVAAVGEWIERERGRVDVLINNAGTVHGGPFLEVPLERHLGTFRLNVDGVITVTRQFLPDLIASPEGHLVNIASASGLIGLPFGSTYAASKWAVIGFTDSIRLELEALGHEHVGVTAVCPSYVDTGLFEGAKPPKGTRMLTPEHLGDLTVRAVLHNRPYVRAPWLVKLTPLLKGALPTSWFDAVSGVFGASQSMSDWTGHGKDPDR